MLLRKPRNCWTRTWLFRPTLRCCKNTLSIPRMFQWRWQESERAIALGPGESAPAEDVRARAVYGEALREARTAPEPDSLDPMMNFRLVQCLYYVRAI